MSGIQIPNVMVYQKYKWETLPEGIVKITEIILAAHTACISIEKNVCFLQKVPHTNLPPTDFYGPTKQ